MGDAKAGRLPSEPPFGETFVKVKGSLVGSGGLLIEIDVDVDDSKAPYTGEADIGTWYGVGKAPTSEPVGGEKDLQTSSSTSNMFMPHTRHWRGGATVLFKPSDSDEIRTRAWVFVSVVLKRSTGAPAETRRFNYQFKDLPKRPSDAFELANPIKTESS